MTLRPRHPSSPSPPKGDFYASDAAEPIVCMTPDRLRAYITIAMRDVLIPCCGLYLTVRYWSVLEPWHLPLLAGMMTVPLVAPRRNGNGK